MPVTIAGIREALRRRAAGGARSSSMAYTMTISRWPCSSTRALIVGPYGPEALTGGQ
jgi:hypothetical protein